MVLRDRILRPHAGAKIEFPHERMIRVKDDVTGYKLYPPVCRRRKRSREDLAEKPVLMYDAVAWTQHFCGSLTKVLGIIRSITIEHNVIKTLEN